MSDEYTLDDALQYIERAAARCENHASETKNMVRTGQANSDYLTLAGESQREAEQLRAWVEIIKENHTRVLELEAENAALRKRIQRVTEETARIVNDMYEKEQNDPATEIEARLFVSGILSYADYTGDDGDANN